MKISEHANYLLNEYGRLQFDYAAYCKPYGESLRNEARNNLEEYIAELEDAQRWVPVSEPPKVSGKYLLLNIYDDVYPCDFIAGTEIWVLPDYDTITHWMPLPQSPEVQE